MHVQRAGPRGVGSLELLASRSCDGRQAGSPRGKDPARVQRLRSAVVPGRSDIRTADASELFRAV